MRQHWTMDEVVGLNKGLTPALSIKDDHDFVSLGVQNGNVVANKERGTTGTITSVATHSVGTSISFSPGEPYSITLSVPATVATEFGPSYEFICKLCGFATKREDMVDGKCKVCQDESWPTR